MYTHTRTDIDTDTDTDSVSNTETDTETDTNVCEQKHTRRRFVITCTRTSWQTQEKDTRKKGETRQTFLCQTIGRED